MFLEVARSHYSVNSQINPLSTEPQQPLPFTCLALHLRLLVDGE